MMTRASVAAETACPLPSPTVVVVVVEGWEAVVGSCTRPLHSAQPRASAEQWRYLMAYLMVSGLRTQTHTRAGRNAAGFDAPNIQLAHMKDGPQRTLAIKSAAACMCCCSAVSTEQPVPPAPGWLLWWACAINGKPTQACTSSRQAAAAAARKQCQGEAHHRSCISLPRWR